MRIAVFVDGSNVFYACRELNFNIDYIKLTKWLEGKYHNASVVLRRFYTGVPEHISDGQKEFFETIGQEGIGYTIIKRDLKEIKDDDNMVVLKGDMDAKIGFDMAEFKNSYDIIVYLGGDSDFAGIFQSLALEGKKVVIISTKNTVASELLQLTNPKQTNVEFVDLEQVRREIGREKRRYVC